MTRWRASVSCQDGLERFWIGWSPEEARTGLDAYVADRGALPASQVDVTPLAEFYERDDQDWRDPPPFPLAFAAELANAIATLPDPLR